LDGEDLNWEPKEGLGIDRWHYDVHRNSSLSEGEHILGFALQASGDESIAQLCSYEILEFGNENEFNSTAGNIGAYPTFSITNETSYRPTNEDCLMRIVTTPNFCAPCKEGLWKSLLTRINLLDSIWFRCNEPDEQVDEWYLTFETELLPLGQFRMNTSASMPTPEGEAFSIQWTVNSSPLPVFNNKTTLVIRDSERSEDDLTLYLMDVTLTTPEVRVDPYLLLRRRFGWFLGPGKCEGASARIVDIFEEAL